MRPPPRVLLVGFSERNKYFGSFFYATVHKLRNGFVRAGSHVIWFSDRDIADYSAPFRIRSIGAPFANAKLLRLAERTEPDVVCLMHADLITGKTIAAIRRMLPVTKIVSVFLDPITDPRGAGRFAQSVAASDFSYVTTAGPLLARFADRGNVGFIPNPIDVSAENHNSCDAAEHDYDFFFAGKGKDRVALLNTLRERMPSRRFGFFVQTGKDLALSGAAYVKALSRSRIAINATVANCPYWYSSDRIAQYFAAGCLVAQPAAARLDRLYGGDALLTFREADDLIAQAEPLLESGRWREMAAHGRQRALAVSDATLVARYILDRCAGEQSFPWPAWSSEFHS